MDTLTLTHGRSRVMFLNDFVLALKNDCVSKTHLSQHSSVLQKKIHCLPEIGSHIFRRLFVFNNCTKKACYWVVFIVKHAQKRTGYLFCSLSFFMSRKFRSVVVIAHWDRSPKHYFQILKYMLEN